MIQFYFLARQEEANQIMADVDEHQKIASLSGSAMKNRNSNQDEDAAIQVRFLEANHKNSG